MPNCVVFTRAAQLVMFEGDVYGRLRRIQHVEYFDESERDKSSKVYSVQEDTCENLPLERAGGTPTTVFLDSALDEQLFQPIYLNVLLFEVPQEDLWLCVSGHTFSYCLRLF